jgi:AcrR family transcriptional regulator
VSRESEPAEEATRLSRVERRRQTERAILEAARTLFAEEGYERTTIRAVAARAGCDAALVMQYYGAKEDLFAASARWGVQLDDLTATDRAGLSRAALDHALSAFDDPELSAATKALLRSCLTHPAATAVTRDRVIGDALPIVAETIGGADAELRAGLLNACMLGVTIARYLIEVPAVAGAQRADLERILDPALRALVGSD